MVFSLSIINESSVRAYRAIVPLRAARCHEVERPEWHSVLERYCAAQMRVSERF